MGSNTSIFKIESKDKIKEDIDSLLNYLLSQHMENFLDKSFCKKTKLFIKDKVFMKQAEDDIKDFSQDIFIGHEISDLSKKQQLCDKLANYYLKKINLVSSIDYTLQYYYDKLDKLQSGPFCFTDNKKDISDISYSTDFDKSSIIQFKENKSIQIPDKNRIKISDLDIRKEAYKLFQVEIKNKGLTNHISDLVANKFLITELDKSQCLLKKNQRWVDDKNSMIADNLLPNPKLTDYNKSFKYLIDKLMQNIDGKIQELFKILSSIVDKKDKTYIDKPIGDKQMNELIDKSHVIIKNIFIELNKTIFIITNTNFITLNEIDNQKNLEIERNKLEDKIINSKKNFKTSNI